MTPRGLLIAAPKSGSGKTVVTLGLMRALRQRDVAVTGAKCGPDYIDPAFHQAATGHPSFNLDSWAMPPELLRVLVPATAGNSAMLIAEAHMGLFDGVPAEPGQTGSSADIAARLGLPIILVLDVSGQSQSAGAVALGCATFDNRVRVAGVILNKCGSERHIRLASRAVEQAGLPVLGAIPRSEGLNMMERHLGLVQAREVGSLDVRLGERPKSVAPPPAGAALALAAPRRPAYGPPPPPPPPSEGEAEDPAADEGDENAGEERAEDDDDDGRPEKDELRRSRTI